MKSTTVWPAKSAKTLTSVAHSRWAPQSSGASAKALFKVVREGKVKIEINHRYPLRDAVQAHSDLEGRKTTGSTVLLP